MKNILIIFIIGTVFLFTSCEDELLQNPISQPNASSFYKTQADLENAVNAAYDGLQRIGQYGQNFAYYMEVRSDNSDVEIPGNSGGVYGDMDLFKELPNNFVLTETWRDSYLGIQRANIVLNRINEIAMDASLRDVRVGEMKFLRALTYFNLVRIWGDVPLVLTETSDAFESFSHQRDAAQGIYDQIIKDLKEAAQALPEKQAQPGRATKGAANALLGKVYLTLKNYPEAITALRATTTGTYRLLPDYASVFGVVNENNAESIFEVQFRSGSVGEGSRLPNQFMPSTKNSLINGQGLTLGDNRPTAEFADGYEAGDARKAVTIGVADGLLYPKKYLDIPTQPFDANINVIVLRYADVLLMLAEALNEQGYAVNGEAFNLLNQIRTRAKLPQLTATELPNQNSFRLAIEKERKYELAFENHRWFDLVRTGRAITVMNAHKSSNGAFQVKPYQLLFPVPQDEINASGNKLTQNTGY